MQNHKSYISPHYWQQILRRWEIKNAVRLDSDLFCHQTNSPHSSYQCYGGKAQGRHWPCHSSLQHNKRKCGNVTNSGQQHPWGGTIIYDPLIKHLQSQGPLKLSAYSLCNSMEDVITGESSCKHVAQCYTNKSTDVAVMWYSDKMGTYLPWQVDCVANMWELRSRVTNEPDHIRACHLCKDRLCSSRSSSSKSNVQSS